MTTPIERVRRVMASSGLSQGEFASAIGLDAPKLSKSLSGRRRFTSLEYALIAEQGGVTVDWLLTGEEAQFAVAARAAAGRAPDAALAEADRLVELRGIATELGWKQPLADFVVRERQAAASGALTGEGARTASGLGRGGRQAGYQAVNAGAALAVRATEHLASRGLAVTSLDLPSVIESAFGIDVAVTPLGHGFDGLAATTDGAALVLAAPTPVWARQRFTIAHELGHILAADHQELHLDPDIQAKEQRVEPTEMRANAFAAALLMPEAELRRRVVRGFDKRAFAALAIDLGVSPNALAFRLADLRLIDSMGRDHFGALSMNVAAQISGLSNLVAERSAASLTVRLPGLLGKDLFDAYSSGATTLRPYARLLGVSAHELRASLESHDREH